MLLAALLLFSGSCWSGAATIVVNPGDSIQAAINSAGDGDVIKITAATCHEIIYIDDFSKLTITGAGQGATIIDGTGLGDNVVTIQYSEKITF